MSLTGKTVTTLNNKKYIILITLIHEGDEYAFANEIKNEELTEDYYILKVVNNGVKLIKDEELINVLMPKIQEKLKTTIEENV